MLGPAQKTGQLSTRSQMGTQRLQHTQPTGIFQKLPVLPATTSPQTDGSRREQTLESDHLQRGFGLTNVALMLQQKPRGKCREIRAHFLISG